MSKDEMDEKSWGDVGEESVSEEVDEKAVEDCEKGSGLPWGKHIVRVIDCAPKEVNLTAYTCTAANLKMEIEKTLEIEGAVVAEEDQDKYEGRLIFDDILLFHEDEKDGMKNRRLLVLKRLGLIPKEGGKITKKTWAEDIFEKRFVVITEENRYTSKKTNKEVVNTKVAFAGYETVDAASEGKTDDDFGDI